jgi:hypothetical protein
MIAASIMRGALPAAGVFVEYEYRGRRAARLSTGIRTI